MIVTGGAFIISLAALIATLEATHNPALEPPGSGSNSNQSGNLPPGVKEQADAQLGIDMTQTTADIRRNVAGNGVTHLYDAETFSITSPTLVMSKEFMDMYTHIGTIKPAEDDQILQYNDLVVTFVCTSTSMFSVTPALIRMETGATFTPGAGTERNIRDFLDAQITGGRNHITCGPTYQAMPCNMDSTAIYFMTCFNMNLKDVMQKQIQSDVDAESRDIRLYENYLAPVVNACATQDVVVRALYRGTFSFKHLRV